MTRGLWFAAGAGAGIYAMIRGRRAAEALTVDGLRDRVGAAAVGLSMFRAEVVAGKSEREAELREEMRRRPVVHPELDTPPGRHAGPPEIDRPAYPPTHPPTHPAPPARHQMED